MNPQEIKDIKSGILELFTGWWYAKKKLPIYVSRAFIGHTRQLKTCK